MQKEMRQINVQAPFSYMHSLHLQFEAFLQFEAVCQKYDLSLCTKFAQ